MFVSKYKRTIADALLVLALALLLGVPLVGAVWSHANGAKSFTEKRKLADLPGFPVTFAGWEQFPKAFDAFATDRFGARDAALGLYQWLLGSVFGQSSATKTMVGKDGWLFLGFKPALEDMSGTGQFSRARLSEIVEQINARGALLAVRQIRFGFVVFPAKYTMYSQYLPTGLYAGRSRRRVHDLDAAMARSGHDYYFDATASLLDAESSSPFRLYYRDGTHWNYWGAYLGYQAWAKAADPALGLRPLDYPYDQFKIQPVGGDLYVAGGFKSRGFKIYPPTGAGCQYFKPWPAGVAVLAKAHVGVDRLRHARCDGTGNALLVHDSFMFSIVQYVSSNFRTAHYVWNDGLDAEPFGHLVKTLQPDTVLVERVERMLLRLPHADLAALVRSLGVVGTAAEVDPSGRLVLDLGNKQVVRSRAPGRLSVDQVARAGDNLQLTGWAAMGSRPPAAVVAVADGHVVGEAPVVLPRPDVAQASGNTKLSWCGFRLQVPAAAVRQAHGDPQIYLIDFADYGKWQMPDTLTQKLQSLAAVNH